MVREVFETRCLDVGFAGVDIAGSEVVDWSKSGNVFYHFLHRPGAGRAALWRPILDGESRVQYVHVQLIVRQTVWTRAAPLLT